MRKGRKGTNMPRIATTTNSEEPTQPRNKGGRPRSARPAVRSAISMRAEDADLVRTVLVHAVETGAIEKPPSRLNGQPFAGVLPLLVKFCRGYVETNGLEIVEYKP